MKRNHMTYEELITIAHYKNGMLFWRGFDGPPIGKVWSYTRGQCPKYYVKCWINGRSYYEHRLIFLMHHGYMPEQIDHKNGDTLDNRICNLRAASNGQNQQNKGAMPKSRVGLKGVSYKKYMHLYRAQISANGNGYHLGYFSTPSKAHEAYKAAATKLHKEFARFA